MAVSETKALSHNLESPSTSTKREAPHLLYKTGAYFLTLAEKAYSKAPKLPWPFGSLSFASPVVQSMQQQWLALLYFIDEQILTVEDVVKFFFPPSSDVFGAINTLGDEFLEFFINTIESSMDYFPSMIHKFIDANFVLTSTPNFLTSMLPACMRDHQKKEESFKLVPEETEPIEADDDGGDEVQFVDKFVGVDETSEGVDETSDSVVGRSEEDELEAERGGKNELDRKIGKEKQVLVGVHGVGTQPSSDAASVDKTHVGVADQGMTEDPVLRLFHSKWIQM